MISLYRLLPLFLRQKDQEASGTTPGNLEKWINCVEDEANSIETATAGLASLIDPDLCPAYFIPYVVQMVGRHTDASWPEEKRRMAIKAFAYLAHISGTHESWKAALRLHGLGQYYPVELHKQILNETFNYTRSTADCVYLMKAARVDVMKAGDLPSVDHGLLTADEILEPYRPIHVLVRIPGFTASDETETIPDADDTGTVSATATFTIEETATAPSIEDAELVLDDGPLPPWMV